MREGYAFLDEKCLLLAGEMLREVRHRALTSTWRAAANDTPSGRWRRPAAPWPERAAGVSGPPGWRQRLRVSGARCSA
jgi:hypothetical protein